MFKSDTQENAALILNPVVQERPLFWEFQSVR
jgi:hypothetical protein